MSLQDRATIANMAPEYGATCGFFPVDDETFNYLLNSGRERNKVKLAKEYSIKQSIFHNEDIEPDYNHVIEFDLGSVKSSLSGPKRPQDKIFLNDVKNVFNNEFESLDNNPERLSDGSVVVAAITSCTNTSNPSVMIGAGLLAEKLYAKGLHPKSWVKTSMAPGSRVVTSYLEKSGLDKHLNNLGFNTVGFGCTTCIGNSGPLDQDISEEIEHFAARLSINFKFTSENFETKVVVNRKSNTISISGDTKPFKSMIAEWSFIEKDNFCEVTFSIAVSFSSLIKEKIVSISFEKIALNVIDAFERRARE